MTNTKGPPIEDGEYLSLKEAAKLIGVHQATIREAVKSGELPSFIPRGRAPLRAGPGHGYRIKRQDLQEWYFGKPG